MEGLVGLVRRNYLVPAPHAESFAALNEQLLTDGRRRLGDRLRSHDATIGERLARDQACFHDLPTTRATSTEFSSLSLMRYRGSDYSVPTAYSHHEVLIRGYIDRGDLLRRRHYRPACAVLRAGRFHLQSAALPGAAAAQDRYARPGRPLGRLEPALGRLVASLIASLMPTLQTQVKARHLTQECPAKANKPSTPREEVPSRGSRVVIREDQ